MKMIAWSVAALVMGVGIVGVRGDGGFVNRDGKPGDTIEDRYPIQMSKPTVEEITQALTRLLEKSEKEFPATIVDSATKLEVTDFATVNPNARINMGGYPLGVLHAGMLAAAEATGVFGVHGKASAVDCGSL
jgi:hypothetical protein